MEVVTIGVDSTLQVPKQGLPDNVLDEIRGALMMVNTAKAKAQKEQIGGWWNLADEIQLYQEDDVSLILPRGFMNQLGEGFEYYGVEYGIRDNRVSRPCGYGEFRTIGVREYQDRAIRSILSAEQGVWEAPPGAGKTVGVLEAIRRSGQRALVITDKTNIAEQWRQRANHFLGRDIGILGNGVWEPMEITVALQQTLWSRRHDLEKDNFFQEWGFVCLDECHHLPANTFTEILSKFPAKYRIGVSGTPYKLPGQDDLIWATLGPRIHVTDKTTLRKGGWLVKPSVQIHRTGFEARFFPTHQCKDGKCMFAYCTRDKKKSRHQNNYADIMTELIKDEKRNNLIARNVAKEVAEGRCVMVLSKRLKHLDTLRDLVGRRLGDTSGDNLLSFTGREKTDRRLDIQARADSAGCALFSTIADEALDIPRIDRIHLVWPSRNTGTTRQQIGRGERPHPDKNDTIINDYMDNVGPLRGQITDRVRDVYIPEGLTIQGWED